MKPPKRPGDNLMCLFISIRNKTVLRFESCSFERSIPRFLNYKEICLRWRSAHDTHLPKPFYELLLLVLRV